MREGRQQAKERGEVERQSLGKTGILSSCSSVSVSAAAHGLTVHSGPQVSEGQDLEKSSGKTRRQAGPAWPKPGLVTQPCNPATWVVETSSKVAWSTEKA